MIINRLLLKGSVVAALVLVAACSDEPAVSVDSQAAAEQAQNVLASGDVNDGKQLYVACQACHGAKGGGNKAMNAPSLVNQSPWYVKRQLMAFKEGRRGTHPDDVYGQQMAAIATTIADEAAVDSLVAYVDSLPDRAPEATLDGNVKKGADFYSMVCGSCHGPNAEGNELLDSPALAGVDDWYLARQFELFRKGIRGADDKYGRQMVMMAPALPTEEDVHNVVSYIQSLAE
ncbi:cytochrome c oxidase subunit 2 [Litorivivens lipolytica]|uniref:Cytochrome c oxidase subunit 2 n=1 Tax=Litorivivens lipolytica TaxID=1524264 RepID=A0A7W4W5J5_9GAMM|nr:c-type cytochrome [Litorivivens lipolytica]MBB3047232.1 cytochrome c oxidase subunit 2 [Litorivivens lipolytica]